MGSLLSYFMGSQGQISNETDETHTQNDEILIVERTWNKFIKNQIIKVGVDIMIRLFKSHPETQSVFTDFKDVPIDKLEENKKFRAHCLLIMNVINNSVEAFVNNDLELFSTILKITGERHAKREQGEIISKQFQYLVEPILQSLESFMKSSWTKEVADVWTKTTNQLVEAIISGIDDYNQTKAINDQNN